MLYAIIRKSNQPIKLVTWVYTEPGVLDSVRDDTGKVWAPWALIPIGYKRFRKMQQDALTKQQKAVDTILRVK